MAVIKASLILAALLFLKFSCASVLKPQQKCYNDDKGKYNDDKGKEIVIDQSKTAEYNSDVLAIKKSDTEYEKEESTLYSANSNAQICDINQSVGGGDYANSGQSSGSANTYDSRLVDKDYSIDTTKSKKFCYKQWDNTDCTTTTCSTSKGVCYCKENNFNKDIDISNDELTSSGDANYYDSYYNSKGTNYYENLDEKTQCYQDELYYAKDAKVDYESENKEIIYDSKYFAKESDTKIGIDVDSGKESGGKGCSEDKTVIVTKDECEKGPAKVIDKKDDCAAEDSKKEVSETVVITTVTEKATKEEEGKCKDEDNKKEGSDDKTIIICKTETVPITKKDEDECVDEEKKKKKKPPQDKKGKPCGKGKGPKKDKETDSDCDSD